VWATWCSPCRAEMPALDAFYRAHRADGVTVIGLSADDPHDRKDVVKVMRAFSYPAALLADAKANGFGRPTVVPITYVVDADGVIAAILMPSRSGGVTEETLDHAVQPLLDRSVD
jgi:cytochrome c biogenesis protein CcmG/thiol:disulfide interchange protein DsbE